MIERFRRKFRRPADVLLALRIGVFMATVPRLLARDDLPAALGRIRGKGRPPAADADAAVERIVRLRRMWFRIPPLAPYNTCFTRALTLYRFLDAPGRSLSIHFVLEPPRWPGDRLHSHAWVTLDGRVLEEPDLSAQEGVREMFRHPAAATAPLAAATSGR
jgi:hypothetical protein